MFFNSIALIKIKTRNIAEYENIYMSETDNSYEITNNIHCIDKPKYNIKTPFNNKIGLTFRSSQIRQCELLRYNFINATKELQNKKDNIEELKYNHIKDYYLKNPRGIYDIKEFTNDSLNNEIYKILYPIVYIDNKKKSDIVIKLNSDFTIENGQRQPWLVKDFIEILKSLGINNFENII